MPHIYRWRVVIWAFDLTIWGYMTIHDKLVMLIFSFLRRKHLLYTCTHHTVMSCRLSSHHTMQASMHAWRARQPTSRKLPGSQDWLIYIVKHTRQRSHMVHEHQARARTRQRCCAVWSLIWTLRSLYSWIITTHPFETCTGSNTVNSGDAYCWITFILAMIVLRWRSQHNYVLLQRATKAGKKAASIASQHRVAWQETCYHHCKNEHKQAHSVRSVLWESKVSTTCHELSEYTVSICRLIHTPLVKDG